MRSPAVIFKEVISNRWFAVALLLAAGVLLSLVATSFDNSSVPLAELSEKPEPVDKIVPVKRIEQLSSKLNQPPPLSFAIGKHPFYTSHFKPPPTPTAPETKPVPPPPVFRKFVLLFQGVYQTADGRNNAFVKLDNKLSVLPVGATVLNDWAIADISRKNLSLTNRSGATNILEFNRELTLEIQEK